MTHTKQPWPPQYTLRRSLRARRTFLQVNTSAELEIVVPAHQRGLNIEALLQDKRAWIEKTIQKIQKTLPQTTNNQVIYPTYINYPAIETQWKLQYYPNPAQQQIQLCILPSEHTLSLNGNLSDQRLVQHCLLQWTQKEAYRTLLPWLAELSSKHNLHYHRAIIRGQRTLWGSCNARKTISLNYKLLFLPKLLAEHVLLHELCHTRHLNHSPKFWFLLASLDPLCKIHKNALKTAHRYLPDWVRTTGV